MKKAPGRKTGGFFISSFARDPLERSESQAAISDASVAQCPEKFVDFFFPDLSCIYLAVAFPAASCGMAKQNLLGECRATGVRRRVSLIDDRLFPK